MAGVGLEAIAMEQIEKRVKQEGKGKRCGVEALRNGPAEENSATPPVFHQIQQENE